MKLNVYMHSGEEYEIEAKNYNAAEIHEQRNNNDIQSILLGDYSLSKINIRDIVPIKNADNDDKKE